MCFIEWAWRIGARIQVCGFFSPLWPFRISRSSPPLFCCGMLIGTFLFARLGDQLDARAPRAAPPAFTACFLSVPASWSPVVGVPPSFLYHHTTLTTTDSSYRAERSRQLCPLSEQETCAAEMRVVCVCVCVCVCVYITAGRIRSLEIAAHPQTTAAAAAADRETWVFPHSLSCCCFILCCRAPLNFFCSS